MEIVSEEEPEMDVDIDLAGMDLNSSRVVEEDESTAGEMYSKSTGDRTFQKFVNRLDGAPEQILRYTPPDFVALVTWYAGSNGRYLRIEGGGISQM
jgi:hypothetical protein